MTALAARARGWPCLVLNADYQPLSYHPLSLLNWKEAIKAVFLERVSIVAQYDQQIHSPSMAMALPSVVALKDYVKQNRIPAFTRFNVFLRDGFACVYCGAGDELTFDHLIPRSKGGRTRWDNIVTACSPCNLRKGGRLPRQAGMVPAHPPRRPTPFELQAQGRRFPPGFLHESWLDYLYWDAELEA